MTVVFDASVAVKWLLDGPLRENGTEKATRLMESVLSGRQRVLQPIHWLPEIAGVLARVVPDSAADHVTLLSAAEIPVANEPPVIRRAVELAIELKQHVFDTMYHAVALATPGALLVTADDRYFRAARGKGRIVKLSDWR